MTEPEIESDISREEDRRPGMTYGQIALIWAFKLTANFRQRFVFPFLPAVSRLISLKNAIF